MRGAAVGVDHARHAGGFLAAGAGGQVQRAFDPQSVAGLEGDARPGGEVGGVDDRGQ